MPHPSDFELKLGFDQIRDRLKNYCLSSLGTGLVDQLQFNRDHKTVVRLLQECNEFKQILEKGEPFPGNHYINPEEFFKKASIEGNYLDEQDFLALAYAIQTIVEARNFLLKSKEVYPYLSQLTEPVTLTNQIAKQITLVVDDNATIKDSATKELSHIRRRLREEQSRLRKTVDHVYRQAIEQRWVPEGALPTIRDGRLVIPILAEHKRRLKGFILDESATGQTVFMEPAEALEANNEIRDLQHAERREVIRILKELTNTLRLQIPELEVAFTFLAQMDFIRAKAKLAMELHATMPIVEARPVLQWTNTRHPLLFLTLKGKRPVVPLTIQLTEADRMLLVSGPNAGGKSVCLKTVGLIQYMLQVGLLVPMDDYSVTGIFDDVFIDIGDQQSIENDLSTYSSHLKNMNHFMNHANENTLVLLDELGSGTDPNFGGAIAEAILSSLLHKRVWGVATTHYYNLKLFAGKHDGIQNAAMRFDEKNLLPLYLLDIGKPGSSFALEIATKIGLPDSTLNIAKQIVGKELLGFETLVRNLEQEKNQLSAKIQQLEQQEEELKATLARYKKLSGELELKKRDIIDKAKQEAASLLKETNREIEKTIRHIRENQAHKKETLRVRKNLQDLSHKVTKASQVKAQALENAIIQVGDRVRIIGQDGSGVVLAIKGKHATIQLGELKSVINMAKLEKVDGTTVSQEVSKRLRSVGLNIQQKQATFSSTLDVRGKRVEEVVPELDQFMDTAILLGQGEVKILHGKGGGVLRKVVREQLRKYKQVASVADEHIERGGDGITVVVLK
jgi:DNA mismatch repair protein MutS2